VLKTAKNVMKMIDTIVLILPLNRFNVAASWKFDPDAKGLFEAPFIPFAGQHFVKCIQNMSKEDIAQRVYKPRLTLIKRKSRSGTGFIITLKIEFSIPKLLYSNNFDEVQDNDFEKVVNLLKLKLLKMGITVSFEDLRAAEVQTVHYGKNIVFTDYTTATSIMDTLKKIKLTRRLDLNETSYQNEGEAVRYHSKSFQLIFYDKIAELQYSKARSIEKMDREFNYQPDIFSAIRKKDNPLEVLRIELRLVGKTCIKAQFKKAGLINEFTFKSLFQAAVSQKLLCSYWDQIFMELKPVLLQELTLSEQLIFIAKQRRQWRPQRVLSMIAVSSLIKESGYRKIRQQFNKFFSGRSMERTFQDIKDLDFTISNKVSAVNQITHALNDFSALKMANYDIQSLV
jgi:hypothetical protein